jgi:hypothetical protein
MEQAQKYVDEHLHTSGKHNTTVHERVAPAVTHETVKPHRHERLVTAVNREVHQTHYHTSIQPVHHREVLPEVHHHNVLPIEKRKFKHGKDHEVAARLREEEAKYKDLKTIAETTESQESIPVYTGEHIHHHVREIIQPIIHKETIEPHVIHTIIRIHEHHENAARFHETSSLPALSLADFKAQGGVLTGRESRVDSFDGEPRSVGGALGSHRLESEGNRVSTPTDPNLINTTSHARRGSDDSTYKRPVKPELSTKLSGTGASTIKKPTLGEKLNPRIDADGDGRAGIMT